MNWHAALRVAVGIAIGLGLATLPFLQYGARTHAHHHAPSSIDAARKELPHASHAH
jgi:hypothetical protein